MPAVASACLLAAAVVAGWPTRRRIRRRELGFGTASASSVLVAAVRQVPTRAGRLLPEHGSRLALVAAMAAGVAAFALGGPVAALVVAVYVGLGVRALSSGYRSRRAQRQRALAVDALAACAAELRAGLPPPPDLGFGLEPTDDLATRSAAAVALAEQTGAPLAELLDRIEADVRSTDRALAAAAAQTAGARATAVLLAGLPAAGIGIGYAIGADPLRMLLYEPIGAACAVAALTLQLAGMAWSRRIARAGLVDR
jgi:tight adherence protein B